MKLTACIILVLIFRFNFVSEEEIIGADNFSGSIQNNFFFEYLAK